MKVELVSVMGTILNGIVQVILQVYSLSFGIGIFSVAGDFDRFRGSVDEMMTGVGEVGEGVTGGLGGTIRRGQIPVMVGGVVLTDIRRHCLFCLLDVTIAFDHCVVSN